MLNAKNKSVAARGVGGHASQSNYPNMKNANRGEHFIFEKLMKHG